MRVVDLIDGREKAETDLRAVLAAISEEPVIESFAVTHAMHCHIETYPGHKNEIDFLGLNRFVMSWLFDAPRVFDQFSIRSKSQILDLVRLEIHARNNRLNVWILVPHFLDDRSCIDFVEFFDGQEDVEIFDES